MNNNWICTDDDSMQHVKNLGDNSFRIIDMIWVNTGQLSKMMQILISWLTV